MKPSRLFGVSVLAVLVVWGIASSELTKFRHSPANLLARPGAADPSTLRGCGSSASLVIAEDEALVICDGFTPEAYHIDMRARTYTRLERSGSGRVTSGERARMLVALPAGDAGLSTLWSIAKDDGVELVGAEVGHKGWIETTSAVNVRADHFEILGMSKTAHGGRAILHAYADGALLADDVERPPGRQTIELVWEAGGEITARPLDPVAHCSSNTHDVCDYFVAVWVDGAWSFLVASRQRRGTAPLYWVSAGAQPRRSIADEGSCFEWPIGSCFDRLRLGELDGARGKRYRVNLDASLSELTPSWASWRERGPSVSSESVYRREAGRLERVTVLSENIVGGFRRWEIDGESVSVSFREASRSLHERVIVRHRGAEHTVALTQRAQGLAEGWLLPKSGGGHWLVSDEGAYVELSEGLERVDGRSLVHNITAAAEDERVLFRFVAFTLFVVPWLLWALGWSFWKVRVSGAPEDLRRRRGASFVVIGSITLLIWGAAVADRWSVWFWLFG